MSEIWLPVAEFPDTYEVSSVGRVRRVTDSGKKAKAGDVLSPNRIKNGRMVVRLWKDGVVVSRYVHRLVAIAFLGNYPELEVCHADGDPTNNHLDNLRWDTHQANMRDMVMHGRSKKGRWTVTQCSRGHEYTAETTYMSPRGRRSCRICNRENQVERRARLNERKS
jgi:hypothetical protein